MKTKGLSMLELVVAIALSAIALWGGATLLKSVGKQTNNASTKFTQRTLLATISGSLQKHLASGDLRFFAFTGLSSPNRLMARAVLPLPGNCGDFPATADPACNDDVSLLYVHYDKLTTPTITVLCNYVDPKPGASAGGNHLHGKWLVDLYTDTYGPPVLAQRPAQPFDGFDIVGPPSAPYIRGAIKVEDKQILALMNPPLATLWVASNKPAALAGVNATDPTTSGVPAECVKNMRRNPGDLTKYLVDKLYTIEYTPLVIHQFTGGTGTNIDEAALKSAQGAYPLRLFSASFRSVGRRKTTPTNQYEFALSPCNIVTQEAANTATKTILGCSDNPIATVPGIEQSRIEEVFQVKFSGTPAERFEILGTLQTVSPTCTGPLCVKLPAAYPTIPSVSAPSGVAESFENFDGSTFSFLKQEAISRLRFKLIGSNGKEDTFDIIFP